MKEKARPRRTAGAECAPEARELAALKLKLRKQTRELRQSVSEAEEARGLSAKLYTTMLENSGLGMGYYKLDGTLLYFNQAAVKEIGGKPHDYVGKSIGEIFGAPDSQEWKRRISAAAAGHTLTGYEDHIVLPGGGRWFLSSYALVRDAAGAAIGVQIVSQDITERKEAEEAFRSLVENSIQGFAIIQEGRIVFCNEAFTRMSGYTREETLRLSPEEVAATVHPEDRTRAMTAMNDVIAGKGAPPVQPLRLFNKQGMTRWVEVLAARATYNSNPAVQISYMDVTEGREAEEALRESESRFRMLIENAPVAIDISREGRAIYRNLTYARLFGFEAAAELGGRSISEQVAPRHRKEVRARALQRSRGLPAEMDFESVGLRRDGTEFPFKAAVTILDLADGPATVSFITDITAQKDFEQKLGDSHLKLRSLASHLLSAREAERKSVAREIHDELGQLLTAFKMDLRWIEKRLRSSDVGILEKIRSTSGLADQAIDIVRRIASDLRPVMLDDLGLPAAIEWLGGEFSKRTRIKCDTEVTLHESRIGGDSATALFRIVQECLNNVGRDSRASHVSIRLRESDGRLEIIVEDDGIGITSEQAADSGSFGLIGMRERVEGLGGQLVVQGRKGKGTKVHAIVPLPSEGGLA